VHFESCRDIGRSTQCKLAQNPLQSAAVLLSLIVEDRMKALSRDQVQSWIEACSLEAYVCSDCEGIHLPVWEGRPGVLEARCFVESDRCSVLTEIAIRPSAVLPLQGAVHFMNYDFSLLKVMISMDDEDVPRMLLTLAIPLKHLSAPMFKDWLDMLLTEMDAIYDQLTDMDVLMIHNELDDPVEDFDDKLH
jgi:hypothetical protein